MLLHRNQYVIAMLHCKCHAFSDIQLCEDDGKNG